MRRILLLFSIFSGLALAQGQTIVQQLFTSQTANLNTSPVTQVGQAGHQVYLQTTGTCSGTSFPVGSLQYSFDNSTYTNFGTVANPNQTGQVFTSLYTGSGAYNYVRFSLTFPGSGTSCSVSAWYTGTPAPLTTNLQSPTQAQAVSGTFNPNLSAVGPALGTNMPLSPGGGSGGLFGYGSSSVHSTGFPAPIVQCDNTAWASVGATSTAEIVAPANGSTAALLSQQYVHVCAMIISISAAGTVQLGLYGANGSCTSIQSNITPAIQFAAAGNLTIGGGLGRLFSVQAGTASTPWTICATTTGSGAAATVWLSYAVF